MLKVHAKNVGKVGILCLQGQIVNGELEILRKAVNGLSDVNVVVLDLARVTIVDAGGLGAMLELRHQAEAKGIRFELANVTRWVSHVLQVSKLDSVFRITSVVEYFPAISRNTRESLAALAPCA